MSKRSSKSGPTAMYSWPMRFCLGNGNRAVFMNSHAFDIAHVHGRNLRPLRPQPRAALIFPVHHGTDGISGREQLGSHGASRLPGCACHDEPWLGHDHFILRGRQSEAPTAGDSGGEQSGRRTAWRQCRRASLFASHSVARRASGDAPFAIMCTAYEAELHSQAGGARQRRAPAVRTSATEFPVSLFQLGGFAVFCE
jgi:hypothetical protein